MLKIWGVRKIANFVSQKNREISAKIESERHKDICLPDKVWLFFNKAGLFPNKGPLLNNKAGLLEDAFSPFQIHERIAVSMFLIHIVFLSEGLHPFLLINLREECVSLLRGVVDVG